MQYEEEFSNFYINGKFQVNKIRKKTLMMHCCQLILLRGTGQTKCTCTNLGAHFFLGINQFSLPGLRDKKRKIERERERNERKALKLKNLL